MKGLFEYIVASKEFLKPQIVPSDGVVVDPAPPRLAKHLRDLHLLKVSVTTEALAEKPCLSID
jgi:hypothetical protein